MKVILITGASRGIGAATAKLAARQGYAVAVNYLQNQTAANEVVSDITGKSGTAIALQGDISKEEEIKKLFEKTERLLGPIHGLVNNAGVLEKQMRLVDMDIARLQRIFTANIIGQMICAREAVKRMSFKHGGNGGVIVNVSSTAAKTGAPGEYIDYAASKGAMDTFYHWAF